jgi:microcystin-dependent protein
VTGLLKSIAASFLFSSGDVKSSASANAQTGWLACDGTSYTTAAYPALYASIGYTWGGGGGNFNVPDFRGRTLIGNGTGGGLTARTVGQQTIGEETHLLSTNEMPVHTHAASDSGHAHTIPYNLQGVGAAGGGTPIVGATSPLGTSTSYANISVANAGNGAAHNNMQPSAVIHWLIKT